MRLGVAFGLALCGLFVLGAAAPVRAEYYNEPHELDVTGPYIQAASGMVFPEALAGFSRTGVISYNSERTDESADYLLDVPGKKIGISVYVYPVPADIGVALANGLPQDDLIAALYMLSEQLFADEEQTIVELHSGADVLEEGETSHDEPGISYPGNVATFRYDEDFFGRVQPVRSQLYLFPLVGRSWMVKYRVTYPDGTDGASEADAFIHALRWTIRGLK